MMWKRKLSSITVQLRTMFIALLFFLMVLQVCMFSWTRNAVTQELYSSAKSHVTYLRDTLSDHVITIYAAAHQLLEDNTLKEYAISVSQLNNYEKTIARNSIIEMLKKAQYSNPLIDEIRLILLEEESMFSSNSGYRGIPSAEETEAILAEAVSQGRFTTQRNRTLVVWSSWPLMLKDTGNNYPQLYLEIILDEKTLQDHLASFNSYSDKNACLFSHETGNLLVSKDTLHSPQTIQAALQPHLEKLTDEAPVIRELRIDGTDYLAVACYSNLLKCSFCQLIPANAIKTIPNRFQLFTALIALCALIGSAVYSLFMRKKLVKPLQQLISAYESVGSGDLGVRVENHSNDEFALLSSHFNRMLERLNQQILINYEQKMLLQRAELKQLQAQIHPHFLYNSFFMVRHMVQSGNAAQADQALNHMGCYFKYIARNGQDSVLLQEEYQHAMDYLAIQAMRYGERIIPRIDPVPPRLGRQQVPRLILQPLLENIFKHCLPMEEQEIRIGLHFDMREKDYSIFVEDNGHSLSLEKIQELENHFSMSMPLEETTGLMNVHKRLQLVFGQGFGLHASRSAWGGLMLEIRLCFREDQV